MIQVLKLEDILNIEGIGMKRIFTLLCIYMLCFWGIGSIAKDNIKTNNQQIVSSKFETEYWALIISTNTTNITSIYNSIINKPNWDESHIILLKREEARKENILEALDWLKNKSDSRDTVLFSFTGHGTPKNSKYGISPWGKNTIFVDELDEKLDSIDCKNMCLIFDCCLSGSFIESTSKNTNINDFYFFRESLKIGLDDEDRAILMSTMKRGGGFVASVFEDDREINVISFARFVANAFLNEKDDNNDGLVSAEEAFRYGRKKFLPFALFFFLCIPLQIQALIQSRGFLLIPFPTIYDGVEGELPIVKIDSTVRSYISQ